MSVQILKMHTGALSSRWGGGEELLSLSSMRWGASPPGPCDRGILSPPGRGPSLHEQQQGRRLLIHRDSEHGGQRSREAEMLLAKAPAELRERLLLAVSVSRAAAQLRLAFSQQCMSYLQQTCLKILISSSTAISQVSFPRKGTQRQLRLAGLSRARGRARARLGMQQCGVGVCATRCPCPSFSGHLARVLHPADCCPALLGRAGAGIATEHRNPQ